MVGGLEKAPQSYKEVGLARVTCQAGLVGRAPQAETSKSPEV